ncbi:Hyccin [Acipenser ruthenus]|uniref:Hyccin n=1 Tax=Acipenser ruthenus TaxID=7906 RepID=A0A662YMB2_ACIRT|nr:Hyccin [Acipenser ruthenus]
MEEGPVLEAVAREKEQQEQTLPETAIPSYAAGLKDKASLVSALYRVIQEPQSELLEPVCHQLFEFYRSGDVSLQRFTLQFLPEFIWSYLSICTSRDLHSTGCREALLLGIYNLEIIDKDGQSKVLSFTVPSLSKPSVYHEFKSAPPDTTAVARAPHRAGCTSSFSPCIGHRCTSTGRYCTGPCIVQRHHSYTVLGRSSLGTAPSRGCTGPCSVHQYRLCTARGHNNLGTACAPARALFTSTAPARLLPSTIGSLTLTEGALAKHGLSRVVYSGPHPQREIFTAQNRISICGYPRQLLRKYKGVGNRMPVSSEFLVQLITSIYYALYNGEWDMASKALDDVLYRAQLELYPEALLVGNAVKSSLPGGALKSNKEGTRCIQVEITPTSSRISRNAVTSLSIRGHRWKRNAITFLLSSSPLDSSENSIDIPDSAALSVPEISVTGVLGERVGNGETQRSRGEGEAQGGQDSGADSRADSKGLAEVRRQKSCRRVMEDDAVDLTSPEELMEISEMDEGFCSRAASNASPPVITISSSSGKTPGKSQRKSGSSRAGKEREASVESCRDHLSRKQAQRAMSENLELLSLKRLTLTTSHSLPKPDSLSLARTATTVFSRSFEQVSNVFGANNPASTGNTTSTEANRYSACSLQEEKLAYVSERTELLGPSSRHKQRSPSIGIQLSTDL